MAVAKKQKSLTNLSLVKLYSPSLDRQQSFNKDHAERILKLKSDWKLADDSPFKLNVNGTIELSSTGTSQESDK